MRLLDAIPLRAVQAVSGWREGGSLPRIYGDLCGAPMAPRRIGDTRFVFADHPATVSEVWVDGQRLSGWEAATEDLAGVAATVITLAAPPAIGARVTATGRGLAATHPADIIADLLRWSGAVHLAPTLDALRTEAAGLRLGCVLTEAWTLRDTLQRVAASAALAWSGESVWWPPATTGAPTPAALAEASLRRAVLRLERAADQVQLDFDEHADGKLARRLTLRATPARVARRRTVSAPWVRESHVGEQIAARLLAQMAEPPWEIELETAGRLDLPIGGSVLFEHPASPLRGTGVFTLIERVLTGEAIRLSGELRPLGSAVRLFGLELAQAGAETQFAAVEVARSGGSVTFTVLDPAGRPLAGARVSLDGGPARGTDAFGRVRFDAVPPGRHTLAVQADGYQPFSIEVFV